VDNSEAMERRTMDEIVTTGFKFSYFDSCFKLLISRIFVDFIPVHHSYFWVHRRVHN
jgi:hypothetical protein